MTRRDEAVEFDEDDDARDMRSKFSSFKSNWC